MNQTGKYALSQWEKTDRILMEDFNADNAKIEAALSAHDTSLAAKATQSALNSEISARKSADTTLTNSINNEVTARQNAVAAETQARKNAVKTINTAIAKLGNCLLYTTTFTGTGQVTQASPRTFTFPHAPKIVFISGAGSQRLWAMPGMTLHNVSNYEAYTMSWSGKSFSIWGSNNSLDMVNTTYYLTALLDASK